MQELAETLQEEDAKVDKGRVQCKFQNDERQSTSKMAPALVGQSLRVSKFENFHTKC